MLNKIWNYIKELFITFEPKEYKEIKNKRHRKKLTEEEVNAIEEEIIKIRYDGGKPDANYFCRKYEISDTTFYRIKKGKHKYSTLRII